MSTVAHARRRLTGMIIEIPLIFGEAAQSGSAPAFVLEKGKTLNLGTDHSTASCSVGSSARHHVRFQDDCHDVHHEAPIEYLECHPSDLWYTTQEIDLMRDRQRLETDQSTINKQNAAANFCQNFLERAYKAAFQSTSEEHVNVLTAMERAALVSIYRTFGDHDDEDDEEANILGMEQDLIPLFQTDVSMRRQTILKVVQQIQARFGTGKRTRAVMLLEENAVRTASQSISRPARIFARNLALSLAQTVPRR